MKHYVFSLSGDTCQNIPKFCGDLSLVFKEFYDTLTNVGYYEIKGEEISFEDTKLLDPDSSLHHPDPRILIHSIAIHKSFISRNSALLCDWSRRLYEKDDGKITVVGGDYKLCGRIAVEDDSALESLKSVLKSVFIRDVSYEEVCVPDAGQ